MADDPAGIRENRSTPMFRTVAVHQTESETKSGTPWRREGFDQVVGWSVIVIATLAIVAALAVARELLVPVIVAFLLALVFSPLTRWLRRRGIPEPLSAFTIVASLVAFLLAATLTLAIPLSDWLEDAPRIARQAEWKLKGIADLAETVSEASQQVGDATLSAAGVEAEPIEVVVADEGPLATIALGAPLIVAQTVFVLILAFFVLASGSLFYERLVAVLPTFTEKRRAIEIAYDIEREVSRYLLTITLINAGLGVAVGFAMTALGMPNGYAFGLFAFAMNFFPFIGAVAGVAISFAVALVSLPTAFDAFAVAGVYFALTAIEGQFVTPWLVGRQLRLNTVVILIAVAFWAWLWSVMGMIMAVPLLVAFRVLCSHVPVLAPIGEFLAGRRT